MADKDEDARRARRRREEEEEEAAQERKKIAMRAGMEPGVQLKLTELMGRAEPLVDAVDRLYSQYFSGAEKRPPLERRKVLDSLMETLALLPKEGSGERFRYQALLQKYLSQKERWERFMHKREVVKPPGGRPPGGAPPKV